MKFLADENFPRPALEALREAGNDVRSVAEEHPGIPDEEVARLCQEDERILLTFDKDTAQLCHSGTDLPFRKGTICQPALVSFRSISRFRVSRSDLEWRSALLAMDVYYRTKSVARLLSLIAVTQRRAERAYIKKHSLRPCLSSALDRHKTVSRIPADPISIRVRHDTPTAHFIRRPQADAEGF